MAWLSGHGVNPDWCARLQFEPTGHVRATMYGIDSRGHAEVRDGQIVYDEDIVFVPRYLPPAVVERLKNQV
jgi:hypothetical protein